MSEYDEFYEKEFLIYLIFRIGDLPYYHFPKKT